jgi:uncharacterized membrane protein (DUF4010 family)
MLTSPISQLIPLDVFKLGLVLFLSFLIGLQREERKSSPKRYEFGGVRTYPLLGMIGYGIAYLAKAQALPISLGFIAIAGLMMLSFWHKSREYPDAGFTSEVAGLATYLLGALVAGEHFWVATAIAIISVMLLELKTVLEGLATRFSENDILTFAKFLLLTIVILPILPNQTFSPFQLNPFKTWLVVVAVSTISYSSFLLQRLFKGKGSIILTALIGGAYSSTVTTVALAKKSAGDCRPYLYAGSILIASGMMYARLALLVILFNPTLGERLSLPFAGLAIVGMGGGLLWTLRRTTSAESTCQIQNNSLPGNPLELKTAFVFVVIFTTVSILTHYTVQWLGDRGIYGLATILGVTDVDPFILGMTQAAGRSLTLKVAGLAICIAAASNNIVKGLYAYSFGDRTVGRQSIILLSGLALLGLLPFFFLTQLPNT